MIVTTTCRSCDRDHRSYAGQLEGSQRIAEAIARGHDFGGVFELGNELAKARTKIGIDGETNNADAHIAAVSLQTIQARVSREFARIEGRRTACRACESLASYAGDDHPDEDATLSVLELARDVFLQALAAMSPEARPR